MLSGCLVMVPGHLYPVQGTLAKAANAMAAGWDPVYGGGFFTAQVLGTPLFARGVAADNQGNVYKLTFQ
jgi:hypothetical protein